MDAVRTLVISDLHLGARLQRAVLTRPEPLEALLEALDGTERLVLLGDVVELLEGRPAQAMQAAEPVLRALGARLGSEREVIVVPGNHDAALVRPFLRERGTSPAVDASLPLDATPARADRVVAGTGAVQVRYPGLAWRADLGLSRPLSRRHLLPEVAYGLARGMLGRVPRDDAVPVEYEQPGGPSSHALGGPAHPLAAAASGRLVDDIAEFLRASRCQACRAACSATASPPQRAPARRQMKRASIPALARVVHRLGVDADSVIFGHVHRLGPLAGDDLGTGAAPTAPHGSSTAVPGLRAPAAAPRRAPHPYCPAAPCCWRPAVRRARWACSTTWRRPRCIEPTALSGEDDRRLAVAGWRP